jgi:hypothetical protein
MCQGLFCENDSQHSQGLFCENDSQQSQGLFCENDSQESQGLFCESDSQVSGLILWEWQSTESVFIRLWVTVKCQGLFCQNKPWHLTVILTE